MMDVNWSLRQFDELSNYELYALLQLRTRVFVMEQHCVYLDADDRDQPAHHVLGYSNNKLVACTRIIPAGIAYDDYVSIGRVVSAPEVRGTGIGKMLMHKSLEYVEQLYGKVAVKIGAQQYLERFYNSLGFITCGDMYYEDGIPHVPMLRIQHSS